MKKYIGMLVGGVVVMVSGHASLGAMEGEPQGSSRNEGTALTVRAPQTAGVAQPVQQEVLMPVPGQSYQAQIVNIINRRPASVRVAAVAAAREVTSQPAGATSRGVTMADVGAVANEADQVIQTIANHQQALTMVGGALDTLQANATKFKSITTWTQLFQIIGTTASAIVSIVALVKVFSVGQQGS